jgi:nucleotidyltransferase substrate binding protein (TIGR01987 family)
MDKLINIKTEDFKQAFNKLIQATELEYSDIVRDSVLLRFELTSELAWKTVKIYLEDKFQVESPYPATVYREIGKTSLLSPDEIETALEMVYDRNRMVHDYNQEWADLLYKKVLKNYVPLLEKILKVVSG